MLPKESQHTQRRAIEAQKHILTSHPHLTQVVEAVGLQKMPEIGVQPIPQAMAKIIVSQMLSGSVAKVIYGRIENALQEGENAWQLDEKTLLQCGLSRRKVRTLREFGCRWDEDRATVERWPMLEYEDLVRSVTDIWGLGEWSASMLAIFHFGNEDVFPIADGSLTRAMKMFAETQAQEAIDHTRCAPFRSFLALYLWAALDTGYFSKQGS
ncbi:DNA-3-methyladenine glycosylase family protein [Undibacterium aquatile]|uniref:DNA-3-methyladenine glycosylase II n=1 Tax=Undibacterium aquatile TaxID=1537398 RepID=A0ABR6XAY1_9BURK|nr:DNA-3-methyladenine glycosylase 2 family protein [Undibacterium aquatile]MBC3810094.1 DNA-3-methyladenine glycosylase 2 family protein [Undibacterium aquatile]